MTTDLASGLRVKAYRRAPPRGMRSAMYKGGLRLGDVISATRCAIWCLVRAVVDLWYLNPVYLIERRWRQLHPLNTRMALSVRPRLIDLATDFFLTDERRKRQLLSWVKFILPWIGEEDLFDFTASWQDGIVLCALVETLSPGACPRFNLLKPHHRVNNCRLGITLAQKYLQVAQVPLSPEEMAIADEGCEVKICHLVQLLKWKYQKQGSEPTPFSSSGVEEPAPCKCYARGTGLRAGIVGRRTKFHILTDAVARLSLQIEIMGPNNEYNKEKIVSMYAGSTSRYGGHMITTSASTLLEDDGKTKIIEDGAGHSFIRQRSLDEDMGHLIIPFDYQCVGEGRFLVSYIPRSAGTHHISVLQQGEHVQESPFEVKVSDWVSSWNLVPQPRVVPFDMFQTIGETPKDSLKPSSAAATERIRKKLSQVAHVSKQLTMMKRRVLKKVITSRGEEIICDVSPSPTLSRQSSVDCSDVSDEEKRKGGFRSITKDASQSTGKTIYAVKSSITLKENKATLQKSSRRAATKKTMDQNSQSEPVSPVHTANKKGSKKNNFVETTSTAGFANVVSLAIKNASGGKGVDKPGSDQQTQQASCPITLQVTQYETESDGYCSDAQTTASTPAQDTKIKGIASNTQNAHLEKSKTDDTKHSKPASDNSSTKYNPRALCSKKPLSLTSTTSTSSPLLSLDKMSCVDVAKSSIVNQDAVESLVSANGKITSSRDTVIPSGENVTKFTASNIVGTFLDTLSRAKKSPALVKSGSLPLPVSKSAYVTDNVSGLTDSTTGNMVKSGSGQLDAQAPDIEGESTISQLKKLHERTISLSSQSSSSSHLTRDPSQSVSPSPSRNVSPPTRNASPDQSRNASPSLLINVSPVPKDYQNAPSMKLSPSHSLRGSSSPSRTDWYSLSNSKASLHNGNSISTQSGNIGNSPVENICLSLSKNKSPIHSQTNPTYDSAKLIPNVVENFTESSKSNELSKSIDIPIVSLPQFSLSISETGNKEMSRRSRFLEPCLETGSPPNKSSHFRTLVGEDLSKIGDTSPQKLSVKNELKIKEKNELSSPYADEKKTSHINSNCFQNSIEKTGSGVEVESKSCINESIPKFDMMKSRTTGTNKDNPSKQLQNESIAIFGSSNIDEQLEQNQVNTELGGSQKIDQGISMEEHKKCNDNYVADRDEQNLIDRNLDFVLPERRGSASFDFSDYKPRHKITWSQHRSFSQERKLRKSLSCPSHAMGRVPVQAKGRLKSPLTRIKAELYPHLADCSSTSESGEEAKTMSGLFDGNNKTRGFNVKIKSNFGNGENESFSEPSFKKNVGFWKQLNSAKTKSDKMFSCFGNALESTEKEISHNEFEKRKDKITTKYHIQLISASNMKHQDSLLSHTWSSSRGSNRDSFGKFRRKSRRLSSLSVSDARSAQHPYFFSLGDDPGSDVHSDDLFSRGQTDQMLLTGSSSPSSSCASVSAAAAGSKTRNSQTTSLIRRGRLARSKKWNTFDGDSIGSHQDSLSITGGHVSLDQAIESGNSSGGASDNPSGIKDDMESACSAKIRHVLNSLTRRRASEGIGLKTIENHEDEEGNEEDDEVLQIVIESKVLKNSNSPRGINDDDFGNDDDEESILPQSLTSGPTCDFSSLTQFESNAPTSVENSPLSHLGASAVLSTDCTGAKTPLFTSNVSSRLFFSKDSVSPMSALSNRSDNSDWSDEELLAVKNQDMSGNMVKQRRNSQEDKVRGDWSPCLVDFSCRSESQQSQRTLALQVNQNKNVNSTGTNVAPAIGSQQYKIKDKEPVRPFNVENVIDPQTTVSEAKVSLRDSNNRTNLSGLKQSFVNCQAIRGTQISKDSKSEKIFKYSHSGSKRDQCVGTSKDFDHKEVDHASNFSFIGTFSTSKKSAFMVKQCPNCLRQRNNLNLHHQSVATDQNSNLNKTNCRPLSSITPAEAGQLSKNFDKRSHQQGVTPVYLKLKKIPKYDYKDNQVNNDFIELSVSGTTENTQSENTVKCNLCASCFAESLKSKPLTPDSIKSIRPIPPIFDTPRISAFFSNIDMLSPTASACATADVWSTPSKSTVDDSDLGLDLFDCCSCCSVCDQMEQTGRVPNRCEVDLLAQSYFFQEKTLTPTKYRQMWNVLKYGSPKDDVMYAKTSKLADPATQLQKERPKIYPNDEGMFCLRRVEKVQTFSETAHPASYPLSEPGDVLLTPTKFKRDAETRRVSAKSAHTHCEFCTSSEFQQMSFSPHSSLATQQMIRGAGCSICGVALNVKDCERDLAWKENACRSQIMDKKSIVHMKHFDAYQGVHTSSNPSDETVIRKNDIPKPYRNHEKEIDKANQCNGCRFVVSKFEKRKNQHDSHSVLHHSNFDSSQHYEHHRQGHFQNDPCSEDLQNNCTEKFRYAKDDNFVEMNCTCRQKPQNSLSPFKQQKKGWLPQEKEQQFAMSAASNTHVNNENNFVPKHSQYQHSPQQRSNCEHWLHNSWNRSSHSERKEMLSEEKAQTSSFKERQKKKEQFENQDYEKHLTYQLHGPQTCNQEQQEHAKKDLYEDLDFLCQRSTESIKDEQQQHEQHIDSDPNKQLQCHGLSGPSNYTHQLQINHGTSYQNPQHFINDSLQRESIYHHSQYKQQQHLEHQKQEQRHFGSSQRNNNVVYILRRESTMDTFDSGITEGSLHAALPPQATQDSHTSSSLLSLDLSRDLENLDIDRPLTIPHSKQ